MNRKFKKKNLFEIKKIISDKCYAFFLTFEW